MLLLLDEVARRSEPACTEELGGKGARLVWLARHGFRVPRTWLLPARYFVQLVERHLAPGQEPRALLRDVGQADALERMGAARERILAAPLEPGLGEALDSLWRSVRDTAPWGLAVRSSATCEDVQMTAMAGLATTVLGVRGPDELADAVRQVWASALLPRALQHLASRGLANLSMAVVIQDVVQAEASGVMFTRPPRGTDSRVWAPDERLVNATLGLGAPVVNGAVSPDMVRIAAADGAVRSHVVAYKPRALVIGQAGPEYVDTPHAQAHAPALCPQVVERLAAIATRLEAAEDAAHDVEFVVQQGDVYVVQARPVVGMGYPEGGDAETVWSRANVGEALPGVATPLTWSVARGFSEHGFRQAFGSLGCAVPQDAALVANVHGRFYLNLTQFMRIAAQVPLLDPQSLLAVGGGEGGQVLEAQLVGVSRRGFLARLPLTAVRLVAEQLRLSDRVDRFERRARRRHRKWLPERLAGLSDAGLARALRAMGEELDGTGTLMLACASASLAAHLGLKTALRWTTDGNPETLAHTLTAGVRDLESAKPGIAIANMAELARGEPRVASAILHGRPTTLEEVPPGPTRDALRRFMQEFGDRAVREAELATPRWVEQPTQVLAMLATALQNPEHHPGHTMLRARLRAEREMNALAPKLGALQLAAVRKLVSHAQRTMRLRERMRAWVTRTLGAIRRGALEADRRMRHRDPTLEQGAAFLCTIDELQRFLTAHDLQLGHLVRMRRAEHARDERRPDPPVTFVGRPPPIVLPPAGKDILPGLPASAGVVEGRVHVLPPGREVLETLEPGEILVARTTDVGLTPLFLLAAGVVTELGGPLSHAALVAREYGVPAVVNVTGATLVLRNGDRIRVDGDRGLVERLDGK